jgi:Fic family protein
MKEFISTINSLPEEAPIKAGFAQFVFEKIHPFADGNGRVGRLLSAYILRIGSFGFRGLVSFEEYVDQHREAYYHALEPGAGASEFVEFFLESLVNQANAFLEKLKSQPEELPEDTLPPRRREILEIISDHPFCSFDFISRRFLSVNPKTLHYDLQQLQKSGFVQRLGKTRGSTYRVKER